MGNSELLFPSADQTNPWTSSALQEGAQCLGLSPELQPEDRQGRVAERAAAESDLWMAAPRAGWWKPEWSPEKKSGKTYPHGFRLKTFSRGHMK